MPSPGVESTSMKPSCCWTIPYTVASPRPVPSPTALVVKNGSNTWLRVVSSMPMPSSVTVRVTNREPGPPGSSLSGVEMSSVLPTLTVMVPPSGIASRALTVRFMSTCSS